MIRVSVGTAILVVHGMVIGEGASVATTIEAIVRGFGIVFGMGLGGSIVVWLVKREVERIDRRIGDHEHRLRVLERAPERRGT